MSLSVNLEYAGCTEFIRPGMKSHVQFGKYKLPEQLNTVDTKAFPEQRNCFRFSLNVSRLISAKTI